MTKRQRPADVLPVSLPPRGLSRPLAAAYIGVSVGLFDEMVGDGRMPQPKRINTRKVWDRHEIDQHFDALGSDGENSWDVELSALADVSEQAPAVPSRVDCPRTPEEWKERERLWRLQVVGSPMQSRELMGLAGLYEFKSERVKRIMGASIGTMERLEARGFVETDGVVPAGRCAYYKITDAGERAWEQFPDNVRAGVTYKTAEPFRF
jgi:predicted DNA-binding transcriptional regulator AlpA